MAEAVVWGGFVVSIIGLVAEGIKITETINSFADKVRTSSNQLKALAEEIRDTCDTLHRLDEGLKAEKAQLGPQSLLSDEWFNDTDRRLVACQRKFREIREWLQTTTPEGVANLEVAVRKPERLKLVFSGSIDKVTRFKTEITGLKRDLNFLVSAMTFTRQRVEAQQRAAAKELDAELDILEYEKERIQFLIAYKRMNNNRKLQALRQVPRITPSPELARPPTPRIYLSPDTGPSDDEDSSFGGADSQQMSNLPSADMMTRKRRATTHHRRHASVGEEDSSYGYERTSEFISPAMLSALTDQPAESHHSVRQEPSKGVQESLNAIKETLDRLVAAQSQAVSEVDGQSPTQVSRGKPGTDHITPEASNRVFLNENKNTDIDPLQEQTTNHLKANMDRSNPSESGADAAAPVLQTYQVPRAESVHDVEFGGVDGIIPPEADTGLSDQHALDLSDKPATYTLEDLQALASAQEGNRNGTDQTDNLRPAIPMDRVTRDDTNSGDHAVTTLHHRNSNQVVSADFEDDLQETKGLGLIDDSLLMYSKGIMANNASHATVADQKAAEPSGVRLDETPGLSSANLTTSVEASQPGEPTPATLRGSDNSQHALAQQRASSRMQIPQTTPLTQADKTHKRTGIRPANGAEDYHARKASTRGHYSSKITSVDGPPLNGNLGTRSPVLPSASSNSNEAPSRWHKRLWRRIRRPLPFRRARNDFNGRKISQIPSGESLESTQWSTMDHSVEAPTPVAPHRDEDASVDAPPLQATQTATQPQTQNLSREMEHPSGPSDFPVLESKIEDAPIVSLANAPVDARNGLNIEHEARDEQPSIQIVPPASDILSRQDLDEPPLPSRGAMKSSSNDKQRSSRSKSARFIDSDQETELFEEGRRRSSRRPSTRRGTSSATASTDLRNPSPVRRRFTGGSAPHLYEAWSLRRDYFATDERTGLSWARIKRVYLPITQENLATAVMRYEKEGYSVFHDLGYLSTYQQRQISRLLQDRHEEDGSSRHDWSVVAIMPEPRNPGSNLEIIAIEVIIQRRFRPHSAGTSMPDGGPFDPQILPEDPRSGSGNRETDKYYEELSPRDSLSHSGWRPGRSRSPTPQGLRTRADSELRRYYGSQEDNAYGDDESDSEYGIPRRVPRQRRRHGQQVRNYAPNPKASNADPYAGAYVVRRPIAVPLAKREPHPRKTQAQTAGQAVADQTAAARSHIDATEDSEMAQLIIRWTNLDVGLPFGHPGDPTRNPAKWRDWNGIQVPAAPPRAEGVDGFSTLAQDTEARSTTSHGRRYRADRSQAGGKAWTLLDGMTDLGTVRDF